MTKNIHKASTKSDHDFVINCRSITEEKAKRSISNIEDQQQESDDKIGHWCRGYCDADGVFKQKIVMSRWKE